MKKLFGYDLIDGKHVPNETEAEIVRFIFECNQQYHEEPPAELVETVYIENNSHDPEYTMEMAKEDAKKDGRIMLYVMRDANQKYKDYLSKSRVNENQIIGTPREFEPGKIEEIVDRTTYEEAMKLLKKK